MADNLSMFDRGDRVTHPEYGHGEVRGHPDGHELPGRTYVYFEGTPETTTKCVASAKLSLVREDDTGAEDESDDWTEVIQEVSDRHSSGEITGAEFHGFTEVVDSARSRGLSPDDIGFDPQTFEDDLQKNVSDNGLVSYGPSLANTE